MNFLNEYVLLEKLETTLPAADATPFPEESTDFLNVEANSATEAPDMTEEPIQDVPALTTEVETTSEPVAEIQEEVPLEETTESGKYPGSALWITGITVALVASLLTLLITRLLKKMKNKEKKDVKGTSNLYLTVGNAHNIGKRENQEDAFGISDISAATTKGILAVVADGMGGLSKGEEISNSLVRSALTSFKTQTQSLTPAQLLLNLIYSANDKACELSESGGSGSTALLALIRGTKLHFATVGDSRIYLARNGKLLLLNRPHVYAAELDMKAAREEISFEDADTDNQRQGLTSYIGMGNLEYVDFNEEPIDLCSGDRILLMSDGVFGTLKESEIAALISDSAQETAEEIEKAVQLKDKANQDNYTVVVLQLQ